MADSRAAQYEGKIGPAFFTWIWTDVFIGDVGSSGKHHLLVGNGYFAVVAQVAVTVKRSPEKRHEVGNLATVIEKGSEEAAGCKHRSDVIQQQPYGDPFGSFAGQAIHNVPADIISGQDKSGDQDLMFRIFNQFDQLIVYINSCGA